MPYFSPELPLPHNLRQGTVVTLSDVTASFGFLDASLLLITVFVNVVVADGVEAAEETLKAGWKPVLFLEKVHQHPFRVVNEPLPEAIIIVFVRCS